jgi:hypothetical protein
MISRGDHDMCRGVWSALRFAACLACAHCGTINNNGVVPTIFTHAATAGTISGSLYIYAETRTYRFVAGASSHAEQPVPPQTFDSIRPLLTGEMWRHYGMFSKSDDRTVTQGYCLDGEAIDHTAAGLECWIPAEVTDAKTKAMLDAMIPVFEELSGAGKTGSDGGP